MVPEVCWRSPAIIISSVDFPQPLGPTSTTKRPGFTSSEMSVSATTSWLPELKIWPTWLTRIAPARGAGLSGVMFANGCIAFPPI